MKITLEEIKALKDDELKELDDKIKFVIHERSKKNDDAQLDAYTFFSHIQMKLHEEFGVPITDFDKSGVSLEALKKSKSGKDTFKKIKEVVSFLNLYLENLIDKTPTLKEKIIFYNMYVEMSCQNLKKIKVPISITSVVNQIGVFPSLLDNAFPGYAKIRIMSIIFEEEGK